MDPLVPIFFEDLVNTMKEIPFSLNELRGYPLELRRKICRKWTIQCEVCAKKKFASLRVGHCLVQKAPTKKILERLPLITTLRKDVIIVQEDD